MLLEPAAITVAPEVDAPAPTRALHGWPIARDAGPGPGRTGRTGRTGRPDRVDRGHGERDRRAERRGDDVGAPHGGHDRAVLRPSGADVDGPRQVLGGRPERLALTVGPPLHRVARDQVRPGPVVEEVVQQGIGRQAPGQEIRRRLAEARPDPLADQPVDGGHLGLRGDRLDLVTGKRERGRKSLRTDALEPSVVEAAFVERLGPHDGARAGGGRPDGLDVRRAAHRAAAELRIARGGGRMRTGQVGGVAHGRTGSARARDRAGRQALLVEPEDPGGVAPHDRGDLVVGHAVELGGRRLGGVGPRALRVRVVVAP